VTRVATGEKTTGRTVATDREETAHPKNLIAGVTTTVAIAGEDRETVLAHPTPNAAGVPTVHRAQSRRHPRSLVVLYHLRTTNSVAKWHHQGQEQTSFQRNKNPTGSRPVC
jgi:hypothetical protein